MNYENNEQKIESVYSTRIRAGKRRTYFFDVRATRGQDYFLTITESRKRFDNNGYDRHKVFVYKEDFNKFIKALNEAIDFVKTDLMPDFDFDAFNHDENENSYEGGTSTSEISSETSSVTSSETSSEISSVIASNETTPIDTPPVVEEVEPDMDPSTIQEKKPLEAKDTPASAGDNLSGEEVEKW
ncbi:MAG: DUF3276 family protein [Chitinophagaceae bacterium]|nr:MAG: DUF3276 family protein [Chitinophagaceae bacterium]